MAQVTVTTDDGTYGTKGYVSTIIDQMDQEFDAIYSCGHLACSNMSIPNSMTIPAPTFLWNRVWPVGWVPAACVVHLENESQAANKRVCEDGPVFETGTIVM